MSRAARTILQAARVGVSARNLVARHPVICAVAGPSKTPFASFRRHYATPIDESGGASDHEARLQRAMELIDQGNFNLKNGDLDTARQLYEFSLTSVETSGGWYNLGVVLYQQKELEGAINAFDRSLHMSPSADAHSNIASAYLISRPSQVHKAIDHLTTALQIAPNDPELAFNLGVVLESQKKWQLATKLYLLAKENGLVTRAVGRIQGIKDTLVKEQIRAAQIGESIPKLRQGKDKWQQQAERREAVAEGKAIRHREYNTKPAELAKGDPPITELAQERLELWLSKQERHKRRSEGKVETIADADAGAGKDEDPTPGTKKDADP